MNLAAKALVVIVLAGALTSFFYKHAPRSASESSTAPDARSHPEATSSPSTVSAAILGNAATKLAAPSSARYLGEADAIDRLTKSGSPLDAYRAYVMIRQCVDARKDQLYAAERATESRASPPADVFKICGDITPGQVASRLQMLQVAADAGVHGAAQALAEEGIAGGGIPTDADVTSPEYLASQESIRAAIEAGAAHGDWWSLDKKSSLAEMPRSGEPDYKSALSFLEKANDAYRQEYGSNMKSYDREKQRLQAKMHPNP